MPEQHTVQDVVVIGGGAAGLGAALTLARAHRQVTVIDAGDPRNAPAEEVHGFLGLEGTDPREILRRGRAEVEGYGGETRAGEVTGVASVPEGFRVELRDGEALTARQLIIATGLIDDIPDLPGLREQWGKGVIHCPYCHGYEVSDQAITVLAMSMISVHQALLFSQWSHNITLLTQGRKISEEEQARLRARNIRIHEGTASEIITTQGQLSGVKLEDGHIHPTEAVVIGAPMNARWEVFADIGITAQEHPMGSFIPADEFGRTTVPGVWVAGNATDLSAQVIVAAAAGNKVAAQVNYDLLNQDIEAAVAALAEPQHA